MYHYPRPQQPVAQYSQSMDPIRRTTGPESTPEIRGPAQAQPATPPQRAFGVNEVAGVQGAQGAQAAAGPSGVERTQEARFARLAGRIRDGVAQHWDRDRIMQDLIADETRERFGNMATPDMANAVAESFRNDPALSQLMARLFAAAQRA